VRRFFCYHHARPTICLLIFCIDLIIIIGRDVAIAAADATPELAILSVREIGLLSPFTASFLPLYIFNSSVMTSLSIPINTAIPMAARNAAECTGQVIVRYERKTLQKNHCNNGVHSFWIQNPPKRRQKASQ
jgi:hypothetical protein